MPAELIVYVDHSTVRPGRRAELERAIAELAALVEAEEPQILAYQVYLDGDGLSVMHAHRDLESLERHFAVAGPAFAGFVELIEMESIDVYGPVPDDVIETLRAKASLLGRGVVTRHERRFGFARS